MEHQIAEYNNSQPALAPQNSVINMIERVAMNPDADLEKLERMIDMQERIMMRESKQAFDAAFSVMQSELPEIEKAAAIKHGNKPIAKYARFEDINEAIRPVLKDHGFAVRFNIERLPVF